MKPGQPRVLGAESGSVNKAAIDAGTEETRCGVHVPRLLLGQRAVRLDELSQRGPECFKPLAEIDRVGNPQIIEELRKVLEWPLRGYDVRRLKDQY